MRTYKESLNSEDDLKVHLSGSKPSSNRNT